MNKASDNKKLNNLIRDLKSGHVEKELGGIKALREHGNEQAIQPLVDLLVSTNDEQVYNEIVKLLFELKSTRAIDPLVEAIRDEETAEHRNVLIAAFWESGLNPVKHLTFFTDMAIEGDYLTCLECLTVLENLEGPFDDDEVFECTVLLEDALNQPSEKNELYQSMIEVLNTMVN